MINQEERDLRIHQEERDLMINQEERDLRINQEEKEERRRRKLRRVESNQYLLTLMIPMRVTMVSTSMHGAEIVHPDFFVISNVKFV